ncbi:MAG: hypothetical protein HAW67_07700, partial [Endozoicomonadaceae bacterium]|nr:hypothetical protein [Endozoicomonadaceae bacterium]
GVRAERVKDLIHTLQLSSELTEKIMVEKVLKNNDLSIENQNINSI